MDSPEQIRKLREAFVEGWMARVISFPEGNPTTEQGLDYAKRNGEKAAEYAHPPPRVPRVLKLEGFLPRRVLNDVVQFEMHGAWHDDKYMPARLIERVADLLANPWEPE